MGASRNVGGMIAVIFEVSPADGSRQDYLDLAASLRPLLEKIDGFLSVERYASLTDPDKILSLSFWRDQAAVRDWWSGINRTQRHLAGAVL
jgi:heme-degrading monooxygenase HmoA